MWTLKPLCEISGIGPAIITGLRGGGILVKSCGKLSARFVLGFVGSSVDFPGRLNWGDWIVLVGRGPSPRRDWLNGTRSASPTKRAVDFVGSIWLSCVASIWLSFRRLNCVGISGPARLGRLDRLSRTGPESTQRLAKSYPNDCPQNWA